MRSCALDESSLSIGRVKVCVGEGRNECIIFATLARSELPSICLAIFIEDDAKSLLHFVFKRNRS